MVDYSNSSAVAFVLFILFLDRNRFLLISLTFAVSFIIVGTIDEIGNFYKFWSYPHQFLIFTHRFNAVDFAVIPVIITMVYQKFGTWKSFLISCFITAAIIGFIGVPIFNKLEMYELNRWNYFYSFLVSAVMIILVKTTF
jgi:hypothetical protein